MSGSQFTEVYAALGSLVPSDFASGWIECPYPGTVRAAVWGDFTGGVALFSAGFGGTQPPYETINTWTEAGEHVFEVADNATWFCFRNAALTEGTAIFGLKLPGVWNGVGA